MKKKTFVLQGTKIRSLDTFYDEVQQVLTGGWKGFGRNLDAFVDVLRGGFGQFEVGEEIVIRWSDFHKTPKFQGKKAVLEILEEATNVEFIRD